MGDIDYKIEVYEFDPNAKRILDLVSLETYEKIAADISKKSGSTTRMSGIQEIEIDYGEEYVVVFLEKYSKEFPTWYFSIVYFGEGTDERGTIGILNGKSIDKPIEVTWPEIKIAELLGEDQVEITREEYRQELDGLVPIAHCTADGDFPGEDDQDIYSIEYGYKSFEAWYDSEDKRWVNVDGCDIQIPNGTPVYWGSGICIEYLYNLQKKKIKE